MKKPVNKTEKKLRVFKQVPLSVEEIREIEKHAKPIDLDKVLAGLRQPI